MAEQEQDIEQVDVRTRWLHEALDFTPWLAENLHLLSAELGMKLELVQMEYPIGPFSLDILAREVDEDVKVAIENQLEWTDHSHLGQTLTYAAGCDARIAIWVAPEFTYEHAEALHRLNQWTKDGIRFYGLKVEVVKKSGDSPPEPRLRKVVYPGGWNRQITLQSGEMPADKRKYYDFFQPLTAELSRRDFANRSTQHFDHTGRFFPSQFDKDIGYAVSFWHNSAWVSLFVRTWDSVERNNRIFDELHKAKTEIEKSIAAELEWDRFEPYTFFTISVRRDGSIDDPTEKLEETRAWMFDLLPKFKEVFDDRVAEVLSQLPPSLEVR